MSDSSALPLPSATPPLERLKSRVRGLDPVVSVATLLLALATYVPSFLTKPGLVADDTKQYLYLDPGRLIQSAISMWNPDVGMGTVTHQNIGFLFPMGPYYWIVQQLHVPMWVGQRFWMGSLFFFAGTGVFWLGRLLGLNSWGRVAAGISFTYTPFVIDYIARISAIVMPWAALGWMVGLVILSARRGGWRYPALFGVVIALVGGVNATSILLAGLAPALWLVHAVFVTKEVAPRRALAAVLRLGVVSLLVSLWWIAGLWAEGAYGLNILKYTETIPTVTSTSLSSEVIRGLGYWYFYGQDKIQPWTSAATQYMSSPWLIVVSFVVPALCLAVGAFARWRYRFFSIALVLVGVVVAVAAYPFDDPSPLGRALRAAGSDSTIGLAMRSTNRVVPVMVLGFALLLGSGVSAIIAARFRTGLVVLGVAVAVTAADLPPLWTGNLVADNLARPEQLPRYVTDAASYLNSHGSGSVLGLPGEDFAYYRYGVAGDPVWPGLLDRPYVARQVVPQGEPASVDLLQALDESVQDDVFVPATLAPIARLIGAGDILFESDEQYERFGTARPQPLWLELTAPSTGLGAPVDFGTPQRYKTITYPLSDETQLGIPTGASVPPPVAVFSVSDARPLVRTETATAPLLVAGSGSGLVNAAAAGLLADNPTIFYAASFDHDKKGLDQLLNSGAVLVLTDTNQRQEDTFGSLNDNTGYVEQANVDGFLGTDPAEVTAGPIPGASSSSQTVTTLSSVASIRATAYGDPITNLPEDRPYNAFDGNPDTNWTEGAFSPATDVTLQVSLTKPVRASSIRLLQPQTGPRNRHITKVTLTFDGKKSVTRRLTKSSLGEPGQTVRFPATRFRTLAITVDATSSGIPVNLSGLSGVGFAEVTVPGVAPAVQTLRLPTDLLSRVGATSVTHPLVILLNRIRAAPVPPRSDPEPDMRRSFSLPTARTFTIGGTARISALDPDPVIDQIVGRTGSGEGPGAPGTATITFSNSSGRLPGDAAAGAYAAVDGNSSTSWMPGFGNQDGSWIQYGWNRPVTISSLNLQVVADGRHSLPSTITITGGNGTRVVTLPHIEPGKGRTQGSTTTVPISFAPLTGEQLKITIDKVDAVTELDYFAGKQETSPVGIAEVGIPGVTAPVTPAALPPRCLSNLLSVDGTPIDVEITGSTATGLSGGGLTLTGCGNSADGITLSPGTHVVQTAPYQTAGLTIDALSLSSATGGGPLPLTSAGLVSPPTVASSPSVKVLSQSRTHLTVSVTGSGSPYWLVLGQSQSKGWKASARGVSLGSSTLIDGYANGWLVQGSLASGTAVFSVTWTPQKVVDASILVSGATLAVSLVLGVTPATVLAGAWAFPRRRLLRRRRRAVGERTGSPGSGTECVPATPLGADSDELPEHRTDGRWRRIPVLGTTARMVVGRWRAQRAPSGQGPSTTELVASADTDRPPGTTVAVDTPVPTPAEPITPQLTSVLTTAGQRPGWIPMLLLAVLAGIVIGAITQPIAAPAVAVAVVAGCLVARSRLLFVLAPVGLLVAVAVYMANREAQNHFPTVLEWPSQFPLANTLGWMAIAALVAGGAVEVLRLRPRVTAGDRRPELSATEIATHEQAAPEGAATAPPLTGASAADGVPSATGDTDGAAPDIESEEAVADQATGDTDGLAPDVEGEEAVADQATGDAVSPPTESGETVTSSAPPPAEGADTDELSEEGCAPGTPAGTGDESAVVPLGEPGPPHDGDAQLRSAPDVSQPEV